VIAVGVGYMIPRTFRRRLPGGSPAAGGSASLARPAPGRATVGART
jgi:hypothetical protein